MGLRQIGDPRAAMGDRPVAAPRRGSGFPAAMEPEPLLGLGADMSLDQLGEGRSVTDDIPVAVAAGLEDERRLAARDVEVLRHANAKGRYDGRPRPPGEG